MAVRLLLIVTALALAAAAQAQTPPPNPALPSIPSATGLAPSGTAGLGARHRQPARRGLQSPQQGGADVNSRRLQSETDELYREIMRRSAPPAQR